nr:hypothetical protein [Clostridium gasigenes]
MEVIASNSYVTDAVQKRIRRKYNGKNISRIQAEGYDFKGIIFFGLMITKKGTYILGYNVRMGDTEMQ